MVKTKDLQVTDIIPPALQSEPAVKAFSYALKVQTDKIMDLMQYDLIYPAIDNASDDVLDALAIELRTQHYDQTYETTKKRELVKNTLKWYMRAGTKWTVEDLAKTIFGVGTRVVEYKDMTDSDRKPFYFDIRVPKTSADADFDTFDSALEDAKNCRSHLRKVYRYDLMREDRFIGLGMIRQTKIIRSQIRREG
jgi:P2-related tail formation protein